MKPKSRQIACLGSAILLAGLCAGEALATTFVQQALPTDRVAALAITPQGKPAILYRAANNLPYFAIRRYDAWGTWQSTPIEDFFPAYPAALVVDASGNAHALFIAPNSDGLSGSLFYARRSGTIYQGPNDWTLHEVGTILLEGYDPATTADLAVTGAGVPWIAFVSAGGSVKVTYPDAVGSWQSETVALPPNCCSQDIVRIALTAAGIPFVTYSDTYTPGLFCCTRFGPNLWLPNPIEIMHNNLKTQHSLCINSSNQPVVAYFVPATPGYGGNQVRVATRQTDGSFAIQNVPILTEGFYVDPRLQIDSAGNLHLVFNNSFFASKIYMKRTGPTSWSSPIEAVPGASYLTSNTLRLSGGGAPRIASGGTFWDAAWEIVTPVAGTSWPEGSNQLVSWAGTGAANILVSTNGGLSYLTVASNVTKDEAIIHLPSRSTTTGEILVSRISPGAGATVGPLTFTPVPPATITDLTFNTGRTTGVLAWTAPGNDGNVGQAVAYDIRWNTVPITEGNFSSSNTSYTDPYLAPQPAGSSECVSLQGLSPCFTYYWAIKANDGSGNWSAVSNSPGGTTRCSGFAQVYCDGEAPAGPPNDQMDVPQVLRLGDPLPNPARVSTALSLSIPSGRAGEAMDVTIFDIAGRRIRTLDAGAAEPGTRQIVWDLKNAAGQPAPNGIYFVRLSIGTVIQDKRLILMH